MYKEEKRKVLALNKLQGARLLLLLAVPTALIFVWRWNSMVGRSASILFHFFTLRNVRPPGVPRFPGPHLNVGAHSAGCFHKAREERVKQSGVTFPLSTRPTAVAVYLDTEAGFFQKWPLSFQ